MTHHRRAFTLVELPVVSKRKGDAFTLVELLVVVAVIAIIMSMLLPALRSARESGRMAVCLSNLHQVGLAAEMYTSQSKGRLPPYGEDTSFSPGLNVIRNMASGSYSTPDFYRSGFLLTYWMKSGPYAAPPRANDGFLSPYLGHVQDTDNTPINSNGTYGTFKSIMGCPSVPIEGEITFWKAGPPVFPPSTVEAETFRANTFAPNVGDSGFQGGIFDTSSWPWLGKAVSTLPARLIMMAEAPGTEPYMFGPAGLGDWESFTYHSPTPRHNNNFDALFIDGHAKSGTIEKLWTPEYWHDYLY